MAVAKINGIDYNIKELRIKKDTIEMVLNNNKNSSLDISDCKGLDITLSGNIKSCKVNGSLSVTGNVADGDVKNILILDGYIDTFNIDVPIVRLSDASLSKIGLFGNRENSLKIDVFGTLDKFESENNYTIVDIHGTVGNIVCERSLKVCGNVNHIKIGKQLIGSMSLAESSLEKQKRRLGEKEIKERAERIMDEASLEFK